MTRPTINTNAMKLFGTDGIRGIAGKENMNKAMGVKMGKALVSFCKKRDWPLDILVARDTRESGPGLEEAVAGGITASGANVILAGIIPTPALAHLVRARGAGAGLVISASHNPYEYNGLKPFKRDGTKMTDVEEAEIEKYMIDADEKSGLETAGKKTALPDAKEIYAKFILEKAKDSFGEKNLKIVLDCANGANCETAPIVFRKIAGELNLLCISPDGKNINDNCGSQYLEKLQETVLTKKADLGLAFDGDGDRVIAVDEKGNTLTGDQIIYVIAKMLKVQGKLKNDLVVTTVMSNLGFVAALKKLGINHLATAVGDRAVYFEMKKNRAVLGGEESGHVIYSDYHPAGDGIVGGILLAAALEYFKKPLSELAGEINLFPKLLVNFPVKRKPDLAAIPEIADVIEEVEKKLGKEGRVLVRYSGTENLCRVMVEGRNESDISEYAKKIKDVIAGKLS